MEDAMRGWLWLSGWIFVGFELAAFVHVWHIDGLTYAASLYMMLIVALLFFIFAELEHR